MVQEVYTWQGYWLGVCIQDHGVILVCPSALAVPECFPLPHLIYIAPITQQYGLLQLIIIFVYFYPILR